MADDANCKHHKFAEARNLHSARICGLLWCALFANCSPCAAAKPQSNTAALRFEEVDGTSLRLWQIHRVCVFSGGELDSRDNQLSPRKEVYSREVEVESGTNTADIELGDE